MDILQKAKILSSEGKYDSCGPKACQVNIKSGLGGIYHAKAEHKTCRIFKTLMNNSCSFDCKYCSNSNNCAKKKVAYKPNELAKIFNHLHKKLDVNGLFLSSGVAGNSDKATEQMIESVKILRTKHNFKGYIHFKALPGVSKHLLKEAAEYSTRMSINIESPNKSVMGELSDCKDFKIDILRRQAWIKRLNLKAGQSTQMIISKYSTDKDILKMVDWEYEAFNMKRMYFSSFRPVKGTKMEKEKAEPLHREAHLYNIDFLVKKYDYKFKEFKQILNDDMLPNCDPKLALARETFEGRIDINEASYEELIRIPGIGPQTAKTIVALKGKIKKFEHLHNMGAWVNIAKPFIEVCGKRQMTIGEFV